MFLKREFLEAGLKTNIILLKIIFDIFNIIFHQFNIHVRENVVIKNLNIKCFLFAKRLELSVIYIIKQEIIYIYMLPIIAGQTTELNGLKFFVDTQRWPGSLKKLDFF